MTAPGSVRSPWAGLLAALTAASLASAQSSGPLTMAGSASEIEIRSTGGATDPVHDPDRVRAGARLAVDEPSVRATLGALGQGFTRLETTHFIILSDCPPEWTRARAALLERARHQFYRAAERLHLSPVDHPRKLLCVLINDHEHFRRFGGEHDGLNAGWVAGYYSSQNNRIVFYNDTRSPEYARVWSQLADYDLQVREARRRARDAHLAGNEAGASRLAAAADDLEERVARERTRLQKQADDFSTAKTIHEAVHLLAFNTGVQRRGVDYPFWISEGLAASFETDAPEAAFGPDRDGSAMRRARYRELIAADQAPRVAELVMLSRTTLLEADAADAMYAASAALFEHLYRYERPALSLYLRSVAEQGGRRLGPGEHLELFARHFGDPDALERKLVRGAR